MLNLFVNARLAGVSYRYLLPSDRFGYAGGGDGVDADLTAVLLDLGEEGTAVVTWAMVGELEGLSILSEASALGADAAVVQASERPAWHRVVGDTVESIATSWQVSGDGCPESLWALRLDFSRGSRVIALGSATPDIEYMPDELVVLFDPPLAHLYRPPHVGESAWGIRLQPPPARSA